MMPNSTKFGPRHATKSKDGSESFAQHAIFETCGSPDLGRLARTHAYNEPEELSMFTHAAQSKTWRQAKLKPR
jgi:hypothetical protein